jgi:hypothetical protein
MKFLRRAITTILFILIFLVVFVFLPVVATANIVNNKEGFVSLVDKLELDTQYAKLFQNAFVEGLSETEAGKELNTDYKVELSRKVFSEDKVSTEWIQFVEGYYEWSRSDVKEDYMYTVNIEKPEDWPLEKKVPSEIVVRTIPSDSEVGKTSRRIFKNIDYINYVFVGVWVGLMLLAVLIGVSDKIGLAAFSLGISIVGALGSIASLKGFSQMASRFASNLTDRIASDIVNNVVSDYVSVDPIKLVTEFIEKFIKVWVSAVVEFEMNIIYYVLGVTAILVIIRGVMWLISKQNKKMRKVSRKNKSVGQAEDEIDVEDEDDEVEDIADIEGDEEIEDLEEYQKKKMKDFKPKDEGEVDLNNN